MDLPIVLNPTAGPTDVSPNELERRVQRYGHNVRIVTDDDDGWVDAIVRGSVVVAAGGDGTVRRVALAVAGTGVFTVPALGTANNIAGAFGLDPDDLDGVISAWAARSLVNTALDAPTLAAGARGGRFVEAVGAALVAEVAHRVEQRQADGTASGSMEDGLRALLDHLVALKPRRWAIDVDGDDLSGDLLAVEVLNTPAIGPGVRWRTPTRATASSMSSSSAPTTGSVSSSRPPAASTATPTPPPATSTSTGARTSGFTHPPGGGSIATTTTGSPVTRARSTSPSRDSRPDWCANPQRQT